MESKDGALLPLSSGFPPSAPRTGQVAFTTSGGPTPATLVFSHCTFALRSRQPIAVRWAFQCPECLDPLPKPGCRHPDSATKPDMNVSVHPAPQQRGVCHTYLGNQSPWLFSYRDNVDVTVVDCLSHRSLLASWAGCDRLRCCHHP